MSFGLIKANAFDAPAKEVDELVAKLPELMCSVAQLDVPLIVEVGVGDNWGVAH